MQAIKAYFDEGKFIPFRPVRIPKGSYAIVTVLDFPDEEMPQHTSEEQLEAFDQFIGAIRVSGEEPPDFERVDFTRGIDL